MEGKFKAYNAVLEKFDSENRLRTIPSDRTAAGIIDLSSNDYLGLAEIAEELTEEFMSHCHASFSSSASRLLAGKQRHYAELEDTLSKLYHRPALLFNSGYHANVGCISALAIPGTVFLCDRLIHASVIDGISMAGAEWARWRHNDVVHLRKLIEKVHDSAERIIVVAESIYSMDGDLAPLEEILELKKEYPKIILYLDEAHAFGVRGEEGLGVAEEKGLMDEADILIGTFGKAAASSGAFAITSPLLHSFLINSARSFIFSTAIPPINAAWTLEMISKIRKMKHEREYLKKISKDFRNFISRITGRENCSSSQIVPLLIGDAEKALKFSSLLSSEGIQALPIRRPTVAPGGERIRFSLNASLNSAQLKRVKDAIQRVMMQL